jgi:hypothetical protein
VAEEELVMGFNKSIILEAEMVAFSEKSGLIDGMLCNHATYGRAHVVQNFGGFATLSREQRKEYGGSQHLERNQRERKSIHTLTLPKVARRALSRP